MLKELDKYLKLERLTIEQKIEAMEILRTARAVFQEESLAAEDSLNEKEVYVKEPDDIDEVIKYTKSQLNKMKEAAVVEIAKQMGLEASVDDKKADTVNKVLEAQKSELPVRSG